MLSTLWRVLGTILYPETCCSCGTFGSYLCKRCRLEVDFLLTPIKLSSDSALTSITAAFYYKPPISSLIHSMKYHSVIGVAKLLGELLYFHTNYPEADAVTSVPLLKEKQRLRGFNQAKQLALSFSIHAKIPYQELLLKHSHQTKSQASTKDKHSRLTNAQKQWFSTLPRAKLPRRVILIDDVYTTGSTLNACARPLKAAGVQEVHGLVVAHGR